MAKRDPKKPAGWAPNPFRPGGNPHEMIVEWDVNQQKNRKDGLGETYSSGHLVRQLGLAKRELTYGPSSGAVIYFLYSHSQVSNSSGYAPAAYVGMTREDLERVVTEGLRILYGDAS